jgi:hypothetical protein
MEIRSCLLGKGSSNRERLTFLQKRKVKENNEKSISRHYLSKIDTRKLTFWSLGAKSWF